MYNATIKKGWGYWDTTYYPKGGCFRRAVDDIRCVVIGKSGKDICVEFNLGQKARACVDPRGIVMDEATRDPQPEVTITPTKRGLNISRANCVVCGEPPFGSEYCCGHQQ